MIVSNDKGWNAVTRLQALFRIAALSVPAIWLTGYVVYELRNYLIAQGYNVVSEAYFLALIAAMWVALWVTARKPLKVIFGPPKERNPENDDLE